jgi:O-antigen chain-terminating methyltransferase
LDYSRFVAKIGADPEVVARIYSRYVRWFRGCTRVVDLGSGRGIFLEVLRNAGIPAYGVDPDATLVKSSMSRGLEVVVGGAVEHLASLAPGTVDGIFMGHVIEHMDHEAKFRLARLSFERLAPQGVMVVETPNTTSPFVMFNVYYLDPTHQVPLHPDAYRFIFTDAGFGVALSEFHMLAPGKTAGEETEGMNYSLVLRKP